jgi:hypothetical protein
MLILEIVRGKQWDHVVPTVEEAVTRVPGNAVIHWFAGWAVMKRVLDGAGPKALLSVAEEHFRAALSLGGFTGIQEVAVICCLYVCQSRLGREASAKELLARAIIKYPAPAGHLGVAYK